MVYIPMKLSHQLPSLSIHNFSRERENWCNRTAPVPYSQASAATIMGCFG
uniref:Uncharacterized protein n=1 Tax=Heterorhabditis bacteriophora TaxID=37862 RepID=A0A1I7WF21_HETBA